MIAPDYCLLPQLPEEIAGLAEMGLDLRWSWSHATDPIWQRLSPRLWRRTRNPWIVLQSLTPARLAELAADPEFRRAVAEHLDAQRRDAEAPTWFSQTHPESPLLVAYFSMEFGLSEALPIYSGGLGILAGDYLKTASDLGVPLVAVGLLYQQGYFRQAIDAAGHQIEYYPYNDPGQLPIMPVRDADGAWLEVKVELPARTLLLRVWEARVGRLRLYLLDSNHPVNSPADQCIAGELYGGGPEMRLQQEIALGIGGWRLLEKLGRRPQVLHLNEGHAALAVIERARSFQAATGRSFEVALAATRAGNVFTTHTPMAAAFDRLAPDLAERYLGRYAGELGIDFNEFLALGRANPADAGEPFNLAYLAVRGAGRVNGVSQIHARVSRPIFQPLFPRWPEAEVPVSHVTNGVHVPSWDSAAADELWTRAGGKSRWRDDMDQLPERLRQVSDEDLWTCRCTGRRQLIEYARERLAFQRAAAGAPAEELQIAGEVLDPDVLTLGFARRFTEYKRPTLLLHDAGRLIDLLLRRDRPVQIIVAGKAHPLDGIGKQLVQTWVDFSRRPGLRTRVVFLADYDMSLAEYLVQGVDLWVNTPRRPWEASGTSGMKVLVNGGLNLSELDGWWAEAYRPEAGWAIGDGRDHGADPEWDAHEAGELYRLLETEIVPAFYERDETGIPRAWVARIRHSMADLTPAFSTNRMLREYVERMYLPAAAAFGERAVGDGEKASALCRWRSELAAGWPGLRFGELVHREEDGRHSFELPVTLGRIDPEAVRVELYAGGLDGRRPESVPMARGAALPGGGPAGDGAGFTYRAELPAGRPAGNYTPRIVPALAGASVPLEASQILWYR